MTGEKKIVGLWRESAANPENDTPAQTDAPASEAAPALEAEAPVEREWLDMTPLATDDDDMPNPQSGAWRDRLMPTLLVIIGLGWCLFALFTATKGFARPVALDQWPALVATLSMPLALLTLLWMALLRSSRSEQARFARLAAALRHENDALAQSMAVLGEKLGEAQRQLSEQARNVQQLGVDAVLRLNDSSDKLATNASVIANASARWIHRTQVREPPPPPPRPGTSQRKQR